MKNKYVQVKWYGKEITEIQRMAGKRALTKIGDDLLREANKDVPHDQGTLQLSGEVDVEETAKGIGGTVSYDTPYAKRLHENPQYNFNKGRKGKWLEDAINRLKPKFNQWLRERYSGTFKR